MSSLESDYYDDQITSDSIGIGSSANKFSNNGYFVKIGRAINILSTFEWYEYSYLLFRMILSTTALIES